MELIPVPVNETLWGLSGALSVSTNLPLRSSKWVGVNITPIRQLLPGATCFPEHPSFEIAKSFELSPAITALLMYKGAPPTLVIVIVFGVLRLLTTCLRKLRAAGLCWTLGGVWLQTTEETRVGNPLMKSINNMSVTARAFEAMISLPSLSDLIPKLWTLVSNQTFCFSA